MRRTIAAAAAVGLLAGLGGTGMGLALAHDRTSMMGTSVHGRRAAVREADWLRTMVAHHREAIAAAKQLTRSDRPEMQAFGRRIVADQSAQVRLMELWLAQWHPDQARADSHYEPMMRDLSGLSGDRLDRAFLHDMIGHHMAAVMMSQQLLTRDTAEHGAVADLARTIRRDQGREIRWMRGRLDAWWGDSAGGWCGMRA